MTRRFTPVAGPADRSVVGLRSPLLVALAGAISSLLGFLAVLGTWSFHGTRFASHGAPWVACAVWGGLVGSLIGMLRPRVGFISTAVASLSGYCGLVAGAFFEIMLHGPST